MLHVALRAPRRRGDRGRRRGRRARGARGARPDGGVRRRGPRRARGRGHTGKPIRNVVNIGIGGSDLGPVMAYEALRHYSQRDLTFRFVSNVDGTDFAEATRDLDPAETLFIVSLEDVHHAGDDDQRAHARATGRWPPWATRRPSPSTSSRCRPTPRRSPSSASTPPTCSASGTGSAAATRWTRRSACRPMIAIGPDGFREMLAGFHAMDEHFRTAPFEQNLPVLLGLLGVWYNNFFGAADAGGAALRPVPEALPRLPPAARHGEQRQARDAATARRSTTTTGPIIWGEPGTNGQHAFYQLIHQGTRLIPCDFIGVLPAAEPARRPPRPADGQLLRADRGAGVRQDRRGGAGRGRRRSAGAAPRVRGQPADQHDPRSTELTPRDARASWSRSTSTRCSPRARSGTSTRSTSGASSWARSWPQRIVPELEADGRARRSRTTARPTR